jgi:hypothetical protein
MSIHPKPSTLSLSLSDLLCGCRPHRPPFRSASSLAGWRVASVHDDAQGPHISLARAGAAQKGNAFFSMLMGPRVMRTSKETPRQLMPMRP